MLEMSTIKVVVFSGWCTEEEEEEKLRLIRIQIGIHSFSTLFIDTACVISIVIFYATCFNLILTIHFVIFF